MTKRDKLLVNVWNTSLYPDSFTLLTSIIEYDTPIPTLGWRRDLRRGAPSHVHIDHAKS